MCEWLFTYFVVALQWNGHNMKCYVCEQSYWLFVKTAHFSTLLRVKWALCVFTFT